jgi:lipopolysaccharide export system protein LptA
MLILVWLFSSAALASTDDTQQPIHIEADRAEISEAQGVMTYTGHVVLSQGGIELRADTVVVYTQAGELQRITAQGQPVRYRQQRSNEQEVHGVSQRVEYTADSKQVLLLGQAELWQGGNRFSGNRIQYDPKDERVIANAGADTETSPGTDATHKPPRVTVTLQPKNSEKATNQKVEPQP